MRCFRPRIERYLQILLMVLCFFGYFHSALAQLAQDRWTIGSPEACSSQFYQWTATHDQSRFVDQQGDTDVERITRWFSDGFASETVTFSNTPLQTRWEYHFVGCRTVQVRNLSNGKTFTLSRCPEIFQHPSPAQPTSQLFLSNRIGPGFDCSEAKDALSALTLPGYFQISRQLEPPFAVRAAGVRHERCEQLADDGAAQGGQAW